ncbi:MAG: methyltransferase type 11 [Bacteroidetes bacterium GWF2_40_14]|nr:MAG: methyltransferase type 11 [Bacteroidetes bacterium GWF2_40_14]
MNDTDEEMYDRPKPVGTNIEVFPYENSIDPKIAVKALLNGDYVLIEDLYSSGLTVLNCLKSHLKLTLPDQSFKGQRDSRSEYHDLSNKLLLLIRNNRLTVKKAPEIGWLKILYPGINEFLLPFPQVQGLNSSWQWYKNGITIPGLGKKIHPFYGTYFPTRFEHLKLFDDWLKQYRGEKKSAIDIGIGSGILSFMMLKSGFKKIYGTDCNRNAIAGLKESLEKDAFQSKIELMHGDLFSGIDILSELIVFNPPWLNANHNYEGLDNAIYYDNDLFPRFFSEAQKNLLPDGRIVLLFSNLDKITSVSSTHPIETELLQNRRYSRELYLQKSVGPASESTRRNQTWRSTEMVELWVLRLNK